MSLEIVCNQFPKRPERKKKKVADCVLLLPCPFFSNQQEIVRLQKKTPNLTDLTMTHGISYPYQVKPANPSNYQARIGKETKTFPVSFSVASFNRA